MKKNKKLLLVSALLGTSLGLSAFAVGCTGDYKLTDFVVNTEDVVKTYTVNDEVDFSALKMTALYSDETSEEVEISEVAFWLDGEEITDNLSKITESAGEKTIVITYKTSYGEDSTSFKVTVNAVLAPAKTPIDSLGTPAFYTDYKASLNAATNDDEETGFEGKFFKNETAEYYIVGDDNAFKFLPVATSFDEESFEEVILSSFVASSTVSVLDGENYVALTKADKADSQYVYEYKQGETLLVTENAATNEFQFAAEALGKVFKLNVKPDATVYDVATSGDVSEEIVVQVVDAYNIYNAAQLAVLDNSDRTEWNALKGATGLTQASKNANGIVFHADIQVTAADIPEAFQYTLADDYTIEYKKVNADGTETVGKPEDFGLNRTFLWNGYDGTPDLYERSIASGKSFSFYGNYFDLDTSKLPMVASFEAEGVIDQYKDGIDRSTWYGKDYSNTSLIMFKGTEGTSGDLDEKLSFNNLNMKGNAKTEQLVVTENTRGYQTEEGETLVYAGSVIFAKVKELKADYDNARMQHFFISLFAETNAVVNYNRTKCYDSFQDALYVWSKADVNITNSYFQRAGGPLIIMNHEDPDEDNPELRIPKVQIDENSVMEAYLTGTEIWFNSVGADTIIPSFVTLDQSLIRPVSAYSSSKKTIFRNVEGSTVYGEMNIIALLMRDATDATAALTAHETQGSFIYGDPENAATPKLDRMIDATNPLAVGNLIHSVSGANPAAGSLQIPLFNFGNSLYYTMDGENILTFDNQGQSVDGSAGMIADLATSNYIGVSQGGFSILFGLMPDTRA